MNTLTPAQLIHLLSEHHDALLLDVSLAEDYHAEHLPNALNAAVYEVSFLDKVENLREGKIDRTRPVVVYGSSADSLASATAAVKLEVAGFTDVHDFRGGLSEWKAAGHTVQGAGHGPAKPARADGVHHIDLETSQLEWTGRSLGGKHTGTLKIVAGEVEIRGEKLVSGRFTIDMATMENSDIPDAGTRRVLLDHLMSDDFFEVKKYPQAVFEIVSAKPIPEAAPSSPNLAIQGRLRLRGVEQPVEFPAVAGTAGDGSLVARANFDIDRTRWKVIYGSGKFYEKLGQHLVNDLITIDLKIVVR